MAELLDCMERIAKVRLGVHLMRPELVHGHETLKILHLVPVEYVSVSRRDELDSIRAPRVPCP
jgi:hypothetical protein